MSGIEVAGLVLGILPIAVKAAKACSEGVEDSKKLLRTKHHDEVKSNLFDDLYRELVLLNRHVRKILQALPDISEQRCAQILDSSEAQDWHTHSDVIQALKNYLDNDYDDFEYALRQIYQWVEKVLTDRNVRSQGLGKSTERFLTILKSFKDAAQAKSTQSDFSARLDLWRKEGKLKEEIKQLKCWRKFLDKITENSLCHQAIKSAPQPSIKSTRPSSIIPELSRKLYNVLTQSWNCISGCTGSHHAKLCLQHDPNLHRSTEGDKLKYKMLLLKPSNTPTAASEEWLETSITVNCSTRAGKVAFSQRAPLPKVQSMCEVVQMHSCKRRDKLSFTIDHYDQQGICKARPYPRSEFLFQSTAQEVRMDDALVGHIHKLDLTQKRELALELAYGMMTLSGSPWLAERWSKQHISFFYTNANNICHAQPLVSSEMKHFANTIEPLSLDVMHPLPPVLSLGILLLELEIGQSIESLRSEDDYVDPTNKIADENTDFTAAIREAEARQMSSPQYKEAILACLDEAAWDDGQGDEPSVLQERVRTRIYEQIIHKLESDLEALTA